MSAIKEIIELGDIRIIEFFLKTQAVSDCGVCHGDKIRQVTDLKNNWGKVLAKWMSLLGLLVGLLYSIGGLIADLLTIGLNAGTAMAFGAVLILPVLCGILGIVVGLLAELITIIAKKYL